MKVLIVGRTNVGKSSLFNRISKKKQALVLNEAGITRDILKNQVKWWNETFEIIDSGGLPTKDETDELSLKIKGKIEDYLKKADVFIVIVDGKSGIHPEDAQVCQMVRKTGKPWLLVVNKVDDFAKEQLLTADFFQLSSHIVPTSFEKDYGVDSIVEWILSQKKQLHKKQLHKDDFKEQPSASTKLFVIGKANSGKSSLCNQILNKERMIVCSQAGTTLDTVTEWFLHKEESYFLSDNPGFRRGNREEREKVSYSKSRSEIKDSHIVLLVMDGTQEPSRQEAKLIQLSLEQQKPLILVVNKMDLLNTDRESKRKMEAKIRQTFRFVPDLPIAFISAKTGYQKEKLFKAISQLKRRMHLKISTSELNAFFTKVIRKSPSPVYGTSDVKFYYIIQTHKTPPSFLAFANYPKGVTNAYRRFVINQMKKNWDLTGVPISFHILQRK